MSEAEMKKELDDIRDEIMQISLENSLSKFVLNPRIKELAERANHLKNELLNFSKQEDK